MSKQFLGREGLQNEVLERFSPGTGKGCLDQLFATKIKSKVDFTIRL